MVVRPTCSLGQAEIETAVATPFTYLSDYTKKKIRNLEKRKTKLESYKNKLKSGEKLTPDQYEAVKKFDEVLGMITFANELISHMNQMGVAAEKEKTKRATLAQTEAEGDKLQCLTRQIELYTLMHLTKDELVGTLREECSFLPSPGASLHHFAAGTAKHLINLTEPDGKLEPINYQNVKEKLEEIEPSFNPVPEYEYEDEEEEDEEDDVVVDAVIDDDDQEIDVELVKLAAKEDEPPAEEDEVVNEVTGSGDATPMEEVANESYEIDVVNDHHDYCEDQQEPVLYDEPAQVEAAPKEEEQIKEILTEVTSQFNFMAPAESDEEELVDESPIHFETVIPTIPTTAQLPATNGFVEGLQQENIVPLQHQQTAPPQPPQQPQQQLTPEFGYNNGFVANIETPVEEAIKDELNWQQKLPSQQQQQQKKAQSSSYKNSQRYQRQFNGNNSRQTNGDTASRGSRYNGNSRGHRRGGGGGGSGGAKPE